MGEGGEVVEGSCRALGVGGSARVLWRRRGALKWERHEVARGRVVLLCVFVGDEARRYCVSGRGLNAFVVVCFDSNSRRLFGREDRGDGGGVRRYAATTKLFSRPLHVAYTW